MLDATPDPLGMSDLDGNLRYLNPVGRALVGLGASEAVGDRSLFDLLTPGAADRVRDEAIPTALESGSWTGDLVVAAPDGTEVPVRLRILAHPSADDEDRDFLALMLQDLREERRTSSRLHFQAEMLEAVGQAVIATDLEGVVTYWNRAAERMYGWSADEAIGRSAYELTVPEGTREKAEEIMAALLRGDTWSGAFEVQRKDGSTFPAMVTDSPILDPDGTMVGVIGVSTDITEQRELEARFRQSQKMEAVGRLAGGVAHDFNNLLTVIQGHVQMIKDDLPVGSHLETDLAQVLGEVRRAASLTRQLLAFSRRQVLVNRTIDAGRSLAELEPMLRRLIPERIGLVFEIGSEPALLRADPAQLQQVMLNLALNATDAISGAGTITFRVANRTLNEDDTKAIPWDVTPGGYVSLRVEDTGSGMPPEVQERIFEPFFTTKPEGQGTGLGLSTVFGIVKQSGGHILVDSEPGRGTCFELLLPMAEDDAEADEDEPVQGLLELHGGGETVLLVEDEDAVREVARRALERWGYQVLSARNGEEALAAAEEHGDRIDLVLSDIVMPEMGGSELVDRLREKMPDVAVVLMSGYSEEELATGVRHKATAFLEKPFSPQDLNGIVRAVLDR